MKKFGLLPQNEWDGVSWWRGRACVHSWRNSVIKATIALLIVAALTLLMLLIQFFSVHLFYHKGTVQELIFDQMDAPVDSAILQQFGERGAENFGDISAATEKKELTAVLDGIGSLSLQAKFPQREISLGAFPDLLILTLWSGKDSIVFRFYPTYDYVEVIWNRNGTAYQNIYFSIISSLEHEEIIALFPAEGQLALQKGGPDMKQTAYVYRRRRLPRRGTAAGWS